MAANAEMPVPEMTHEHPDDGFHEIHLSGKQLVFLFMATTVVSVVIFLLGVWVGRGVPVQQAVDGLADPAAMAAGPPPSTPVPLADSGVHAEEPPAPPVEEPELSYQRRLEGDRPPERLDPPRAEEPRSASPVRSAQSRTPAARESVSPASTSGGQPGTWVVQVHALRDRTVANGIVQRLTSKGYPAFLVAAGPPSGIYRVQVGRFKDRSEAERVLERLSKEEQYKPWITR